MRALILTEEKELILDKVPDPTLEKGEVLVKLRAAALNHRELWITKGLYPGMQLPCILGADGAGVITEVGTDVSADWINKEVIIYPAYDWGRQEAAGSRKFRVLGMPDPGTLAEYISLPVSNVRLKPSSLSWEEAAAIPVAGLTAWRALTKHGRLKSGMNVLITGIGGGVAQAGLAFAKALGANIFVTSSKEEKIDTAVTGGAMAGVNYKDEDWPEQLKTLSGGIDLVLDSSPAANLDRYLKFMNYGGKIIYYGSTGAPKTTLSISKFFLRHIQFIGSTMGSPKDFKEMLEFVDEHQVRTKIDSVYPLDKAVEAFKALSKGEQIGKIVISMDM